MVMEVKNGQMVPGMKGNGNKIKHMEKVNFIMLMEISLMGNGSMIKLMDMEYTLILTEQNMNTRID